MRSGIDNLMISLIAFAFVALLAIIVYSILALVLTWSWSFLFIHNSILGFPLAPISFWQALVMLCWMFLPFANLKTNKKD